MENKQNPYMTNAKSSPQFYEEILILRAQELVSELMESQNVSKVELAKKLGTSKAHVTGILSSGRNLTLKTLGNVCYHLGAEVIVEARPMGWANVTEPYNYPERNQPKTADTRSAVAFFH